MKFAVYFPSKLKVQVFGVTVFSNTFLSSPSLLALCIWELHALSLYKPWAFVFERKDWVMSLVCP